MFIARRRYIPRLGCPHRLAWPRTPAFQAGNTGSNPVGDTNAVAPTNPARIPPSGLSPLNSYNRLAPSDIGVHTTRPTRSFFSICRACGRCRRSKPYPSANLARRTFSSRRWSSLTHLGHSVQLLQRLAKRLPLALPLPDCLHPRRYALLRVSKCCGSTPSSATISHRSWCIAMRSQGVGEQNS